MKTKLNKTMIGLAMVGLLVVSVSSCKKDREDFVRTKSFAVVNAVEGSAPQDVYVDDKKTDNPPVNYGDAPTTVVATEGNVTITLKNAGTSNVTATINLDLTADATHTLYLAKQANGTLAINLFPTQTSTTTAPTTTGKAKVRFVNVGGLLSAVVNVATNTVNLVNNLLFGTASAYQEIDAGTAINLSVAGSAEVTTISGSEIQAGKVYTIWLDSSTSTKVKYHIVVDK